MPESVNHPLRSVIDLFVTVHHATLSTLTVSVHSGFTDVLSLVVAVLPVQCGRGINNDRHGHGMGMA